jgi:hypothetical protein
MQYAMKAISMWEPWASLVACGAKQYETRSWSTGYRGLIAIHAAKRWQGEQKRARDVFMRNFPELVDVLAVPPLGCIVAVCELVDVIPTDVVRSSLTPKERLFGDYSPGRYAWELKVIRTPPEPIPYKGAQGIWLWKYEKD